MSLPPRWEFRYQLLYLITLQKASLELPPASHDNLKKLIRRSYLELNNYFFGGIGINSGLPYFINL